MGLPQIFHTEMLIWAPEGAHPESRSCCPQQSGGAPLSVNGDVSSRLSDEVQKRSAF